MSKEIDIKVARGVFITAQSFLCTIIMAMSDKVTLPKDICRYAGWSYHTVRKSLFENDLPPVNHYVKVARVQLIQHLAHDRKMMLKDLADMINVPPSYASALLRRATGMCYQQVFQAKDLNRYEPDPFAGACWSFNRCNAGF